MRVEMFEVVYEEDVFIGLIAATFAAICAYAYWFLTEPSEESHVTKGLLVYRQGTLSKGKVQKLRKQNLNVWERSSETERKLKAYTVHGSDAVQVNVVYWKHPYKKYLIRANDFHQVIADLKLQEMQKIFLHLGAKKIMLSRVENKNTTEGGHASVGVMDYGVEAKANKNRGQYGSCDISTDLESPALNSRVVRHKRGKLELLFNPNELGLVFYDHEPTWQAVVESRQQSWTKKTRCKVEHKHDYGLNVAFAAKVEGIVDLDIGAVSRKSHAVVQEYEVAFFGQNDYAEKVDAKPNSNPSLNKELLEASEIGQKDMVEELLDRGAAVDAKNNYGWTPLYEASGSGHKDVVEVLLDRGAAVDAKDDDGCTPLHAASHQGHKDVVEVLLDRGAAVDAKDDDGCTPLHAASHQGHKDVVEVLLDRGAAVDAKDDDGWTPLYAASTNGHKKVVEVLLDRGAAVDAENNYGWTPLYAASESGHKEVVKVLKQHSGR
mmetsp:Transcript_34178/g.51585  ORF Transcript_34178/g.51585 Transcript_34178/m.51585 type:complete len:491 (-) Transcript_34178:94-1566(-)